MKWTLVLALMLSGCLVSLAEENQGLEPVSSSQGEGYSFEEHVAFWESREPLHLRTSPWDHGPLRIPTMLSTPDELIFWIDTEGLHCDYAPNLDDALSESEVVDGEILSYYSYCEVSQRGTVDHAFRISSREPTVEGLLAPGLPEMEVAWELWAVAEVLVGNETHGEHFRAASSLVTRDRLQALMEGPFPSATKPSLTVPSVTFCDAEETITVRAHAPGNGATGFIDFAPSTPTSTTLGTIDGTRVEFEMERFYAGFDVNLTVGIGGSPVVDALDVVCFVERAWLEQRWTGGISWNGVDGSADIGVGRATLYGVV